MIRIKTLGCMMVVIAAAHQAFAAPGLLIIAHGSPAEAWNNPILQMGEKVKETALAEGKFKAVRTAFLEFAKPDVPTMVAELEAEGCDRIIAVPLFIAPSSHSHFDVPAILGIYSSPGILAVLASEGAAPAKPKVPITLTQTLSEGRFLDDFVLGQVKKLSTGACDEALIVISHGDESHDGLNEDLVKRIVTSCCGQTGISYADWAFVKMGQTYAAKFTPAYHRAKSEKKRVIVVGLYVGASAKSLHERVMKLGQDGQEPSSDPALIFSTEAVINSPDIVRWVLDSASACVAP